MDDDAAPPEKRPHPLHLGVGTSVGAGVGAGAGAGTGIFSRHARWLCRSAGHAPRGEHTGSGENLNALM